MNLERSGDKVEGLRESVNVYSNPFLKGTEVRGTITDSPAHTVELKGEGALDFLVDLGTPVLAPFAGEIDEVVDYHEQHGSTQEYRPFLNYITIKHPNGEKSKLAHLAKGSVLVKSGEQVEKGRQVAVTGNSGWMTEPHLHWRVSDEEGNGLLIKLKEG